MDLTTLSSNWKALQASLAREKITPEFNVPSDRKRKHQTDTSTTKIKKPRIERPKPIPRRVKPHIMTEPSQSSASINAGLSSPVDIGKYIALDCEMVGVGENGTESALARVSIVNYEGEQVYDSYVLPKETVTDWRTAVSGIKPSHMKDARTFEEVQTDVAELMKDRIVVGHHLSHDFKALLLEHPRRATRDTSRLAKYRKMAGGAPKLSLLASELLGLDIQQGSHSSVEDARACMLLFRKDKNLFENSSGIPVDGKPKGRKK